MSSNSNIDTTPSHKKGPTALVTGANSGLGFEAAAQLAERGYALVFLACRSQSKAVNAATALKGRTGLNVFVPLEVDLAPLATAHLLTQPVISHGYSDPR